jgi:hypothetical protein
MQYLTGVIDADFLWPTFWVDQLAGNPVAAPTGICLFTSINSKYQPFDYSGNQPLAAFQSAFVAKYYGPEGYYGIVK